MQSVLQIAGLLTFVAYVFFAGSIGVMALIHRREGWLSALLFSAMLLSMPFWIGLMYLVFLHLSGTPAE